MIKCNVTVCGSISRQAQVRTSKEGKSFVSMGINVVIPAKTGINKTVEISVAKDGNSAEEFSNCGIGSRIEVTGTLTFHKKGEVLYLNLAASGVNTFNAGDKDFIKGDLEFRGRESVKLHFDCIYLSFDNNTAVCTMDSFACKVQSKNSFTLVKNICIRCIYILWFTAVQRASRKRVAVVMRSKYS